MLVNSTQHRCHGFTLLEMMVALVASAVLLAGLGSVMLITRQIAYTPASSVHRLLAAEAFDEMAGELRFATYVTETSATAIEFVVADRDGDDVPERIRYSWSGTAGDPLLKSVNGSTPSPLVESVQQLQFNYAVDTDTTTISTTTESAETLLVNCTNDDDDEHLRVGIVKGVAQPIDPTLFVSAAPANTLYWKPTRVESFGEDNAALGETLVIQLRSAGESDDGPTSQVLTEATIPGEDVPNRAWFSASFSGSVPEFALHRKYALVWSGLGGNEVFEVFSYDAAAGTVLVSVDAGASWSPWDPPQQAHVRLYGTYATPGPDVTFTRNRLTDVQVTLRPGSLAYSRLETSIPLINQPEVLAAYWRADFDHDPTTDDVNGDETADWTAADTDSSEVASPAAFDSDTLVSGVWYASGKLATQPENDFTTTTIAEVRCRDTVAGGSGAVMVLNGDCSASYCTPLVLRVQLNTDGTQTLSLSAMSNDTTAVPLCQLDGLPSDFIRCRLTILPNDNLVNLQVNDQDQGTYAYQAYADSGNDRVVSLYGDTSEAEFDYAEVRVLE